MLLAACLFTSASLQNLWGIQVSYSKTNFAAGDLIRVRIQRESGDGRIRVLENGSPRYIYYEKTSPTNLDPDRMFFFKAFDVEYCPASITFEYRAEKKTFTHTFTVKTNVPPPAPTGVVQLDDTNKAGLLNNQNQIWEEFQFFAKIFNAPENRGQYWLGGFVLPVSSNVISSDFGKLRIYNNGKYSYHRGWDFGLPEGAPVFASGRGLVRFAGFKPIRGNIVVLDHGTGLFTCYLHLSRLDVKTGAVVEKGSVLGAIGMTGLATGPHLHFEVREGNTCANGFDLLGLP